MISVINYDGGNIKSILNILKRCNIDYCLTSKDKEIIKSEKIILPGVSSFDYCIQKLKETGLDELIKNEISNDKPFLGICSGMQILGTYSEEGNCEGLNIIPGKVKKFPTKICKIVPHMGWNKVNFNNNFLTNGIENSTRFYFCHSYYFEPENLENIMMKTNYHFEFCSGIIKKNVFGIQFHPEKSLRHGIKLLENFVSF
tara:strand:+ start:213 stop:812 length:600 start_codon:yes stop_codon:yes gene_type:complete